MYQQLPKSSSNASSTSSQGSSSSFELSNFPMPPKAEKSLPPPSTLPQSPSFVTSNTASQGVDILGVDPRSDNGLKNCYNELYQSQTFRKQVHDIITSGKKILLTLTQGIGGAYYNLDDHKIVVYSQNQIGGDKTERQMEGEILFELHNSKKRGEFKRLDSERNYDVKTIYTKDNEWKLPAYALASEWIEWRNAAECTILAKSINQDINPLSSTIINLYESNSLGGKWLSFREYLLTLVSVHTTHYAPNAGSKDWFGWDLLEAVEKGPWKNALRISLEEFIPKVSNQKPKLKPKTNPFELTRMTAIVDRGMSF